MTETSQAESAQSESTLARRVYQSVFLNYLLSNFGYYTMVPVLPLLLAAGHNDTPWFVGVALFALTFCARASCLLLGKVLHRSSIRLMASGGLLAAAVGFGLLTVAPGKVFVLGCLVLAGTGVSVNTLTARTYIAVTLPSKSVRSIAFSIIQVAVNIAAALGPIAANLLFSSSARSLVVVPVAALYALGAVGVFLTVQPGVRPSDHGTREPRLWTAVRDAVTNPEVRRVTCITAAGWFLYGQLFSALTLHIGEMTSAPLLRSSLFTANAVLVLVVQVPVSMLASRKLEKGLTPVWFLRAGIVIFASAFALMAGLGSALWGVYAAVAAFSVAETFFTPFTGVAFAEISADRPAVEAFNLLQLAMAVGEPLGSFSGGTLFSLSSHGGVEYLYWAALSLGGLLVVAVFRRDPATEKTLREVSVPTRTEV
ncbi:MFS transporter [Streptomyces odontomachi]|uniref:MFS transporter n=1 Tax=Streptomyces odontomachi TaxID=2944940 RepID=UPI0021099382|nr:MFS transporter [Streptomyces sp. ODS25]